MKKQIQIGVSGWRDHDIYPKGMSNRDKLAFYSSQFPVVELDSTYHAIVSAEQMEKWAQDTPEDFSFVVTAYRELTGHGRTSNAPVSTWQELIVEMQETIEPLKQDKKLSMLLFQFPPWYDCQKKHVAYLRKIRGAFASYSVAIEFRHKSWFTAERKEQTLSFLAAENFIHVICDEPQAGDSSIPIVPSVTSDKVLIRFHGRNEAGWNFTGQPNWREIRYAYRYSEVELQQWAKIIHTLQNEVRKVYIIFNNNSQGDAADNARDLMRLLGIEIPTPAPRQLDLF